MKKLIKALGPIILIYLLVAGGIAVWFDDYFILLAAVGMPVLLALGTSVPFLIVFWLDHVLGEDW